MKKKYILIILYCIYVAILFKVAVNYEMAEESSITEGFAAGFGTSLGLFFRYIVISLFSSLVVLVIAQAIRNNLSILFVLFAWFLYVLLTLVAGLILVFILWITQLHETVSIFQKVFIITTISTIGATIWMLGDMSNEGRVNRDMHAKGSL